jgi:hypothetical protein
MCVTTSFLSVNLENLVDVAKMCYNYRIYLRFPNVDINLAQLPLTSTAYSHKCSEQSMRSHQHSYLY